MLPVRKSRGRALASSNLFRLSILNMICDISVSFINYGRNRRCQHHTTVHQIVRTDHRTAEVEVLLVRRHRGRALASSSLLTTLLSDRLDTLI